MAFVTWAAPSDSAAFTWSATVPPSVAHNPTRRRLNLLLIFPDVSLQLSFLNLQLLYWRLKFARGSSLSVWHASTSGPLLSLPVCEWCTYIESVTTYSTHLVLTWTAGWCSSAAAPPRQIPGCCGLLVPSSVLSFSVSLLNRNLTQHWLTLGNGVITLYHNSNLQWLSNHVLMAPILIKVLICTLYDSLLSLCLTVNSCVCWQL